MVAVERAQVAQAAVGDELGRSEQARGKLFGREVLDHGMVGKIPRQTQDAARVIYVSYSPDLVHWGRTELVLQKGTCYWESKKIGAGAPPVKTAHGWLCLYHGCRHHMNGIMYNMGAMLLDLENPAKVIGKMRACLMEPQTDYEYRGNVPQVVFPSAVIQGNSEDELFVYYGAADTHICLATASLSALVERCLADDPCDLGGK